jgi:hypothetical protein
VSHHQTLNPIHRHGALLPESSSGIETSASTIPTNQISLDWTTTDSGLESERFIVGPKPSNKTVRAGYAAMEQTVRGESRGTETKTVVDLWEKAPANGDRSHLGAVCFSQGIALGSAGRSARMEVTLEPFEGIVSSERTSLIKAAVMWFLKNSTCTGISWEIPEHDTESLETAKAIGLHIEGPVPGGFAWHGEPCRGYVASFTRTRSVVPEGVGKCDDRRSGILADRNGTESGKGFGSAQQKRPCHWDRLPLRPPLRQRAQPRGDARTAVPLPCIPERAAMSQGPHGAR